MFTRGRYAIDNSSIVNIIKTTTFMLEDLIVSPQINESIVTNLTQKT
jgi:hypothetical protein